nr:transporter [Acidobacteriota bacterium]
VLLCLLLPLTALAQATQSAPTPERSSAPFAILDNSFLVEEAFNQPTGIFQNIFGFRRSGGAWELAFTQEWPVGSQQHQLSYTLPIVGHSSRKTGVGDVMINYRYQALTEDPVIPAFAPRLSLILPTDSRGDDSAGLQINLPVSKQRGDVYFNVNTGFTWLPRAQGVGDRVSLLTPHISGSAIVRVRPMFHLMFENVLEFEESVGADGSRTSRETIYTLSPGVRGGWNFGDKQLILGAAIPISFATDTDTGVLLYLSYELPFKK